MSEQGDARAPLWCADDSPHGEHWRQNQFNSHDYCSGRPQMSSGTVWGTPKGS